MECKKMKKDLLKKLNAFILQARNGKKAYYDGIQCAIDLYLQNFVDFNGNVTPLKEIFEVCKKDALMLREYIYKVSNISFMGFITDKKGNSKLSVKTTGDFALNDSFGACKWYEKAEKQKVEMLLTDEMLLKALASLYKRFNKDTTQVKAEKLKAVDNLIKRLSKIK